MERMGAHAQVSAAGFDTIACARQHLQSGNEAAALAATDQRPERKNSERHKASHHYFITDLINALAKPSFAKAPDAAVEKWLGEMQRSGIAPDETTYSAVVQACARVGLAKSAERCLRRIQREGFPLDIMSFRAVLQVRADAGDVARVDFWFQEMLRHGIAPDVMCFNVMLHACVQSTSHHDDNLAWLQAQQWFAEMQRSGVEPDRISYDTMLDLLVKLDDLGAAQSWIETMARDGYDPDTTTCTILKRAYESAGGTPPPGSDGGDDDFLGEDLDGVDDGPSVEEVD